MEKGSAMKVKRKDGFIGGRVPKQLDMSLSLWTDDKRQSKADVLEFLVRAFLASKQMQREFLDSRRSQG
jgi:hypothetical protein